MKNTNNISIAKRYAKSLFDLMLNNNVESSFVVNNLNNVKDILNSSDELFFAMTNPIISAQDKIEIINAVFKKDVDNTTRNFLKLLIQKNRFNIVKLIIDEFSKLLNRMNNVQKVDITCAIELNEEDKNSIQNKIKEKLNKELDINYSVDKKIIAGLVYKFGDDVFDTSFLYKLENFKKELIK